MTKRGDPFFVKRKHSLVEFSTLHSCIGNWYVVAGLCEREMQQTVVIKLWARSKQLTTNDPKLCNGPPTIRESYRVIYK